MTTQTAAAAVAAAAAGSQRSAGEKFHSVAASFLWVDNSLSKLSVYFGL